MSYSNLFEVVNNLGLSVEVKRDQISLETKSGKKKSVENDEVLTDAVLNDLICECLDQFTTEEIKEEIIKQL